MPTDDLRQLVLDNTSSAEPQAEEDLSYLNVDRSVLFASHGKKLLDIIDSGEDPSDQLQKVLSLAYGTVGTYVNMLGFYRSDASSRMLLNSLLWARDKDPRHLPEIYTSVYDWMKLILMRDDDTAPHFIIQDALGDRAAEAMATVTGVKQTTARSWLRKQHVNPRSGRELRELARTLQESKLFYLKHLSQKEFVDLWFKPNPDWGGDSALEYWTISHYKVQAYMRSLGKS